MNQISCVPLFELEHLGCIGSNALWIEDLDSDGEMEFVLGTSSGLLRIFKTTSSLPYQKQKNIKVWKQTHLDGPITNITSHQLWNKGTTLMVIENNGKCQFFHSFQWNNDVVDGSTTSTLLSPYQTIDLFLNNIHCSKYEKEKEWMIYGTRNGEVAIYQLLHDTTSKLIQLEWIQTWHANGEIESLNLYWNANENQDEIFLGLQNGTLEKFSYKMKESGSIQSVHHQMLPLDAFFKADVHGCGKISIIMNFRSTVEPYSWLSIVAFQSGLICFYNFQTNTLSHHVHLSESIVKVERIADERVSSVDQLLVYTSNGFIYVFDGFKCIGKLYFFHQPIQACVGVCIPAPTITSFHFLLLTPTQMFGFELCSPFFSSTSSDFMKWIEVKAPKHYQFLKQWSQSTPQQKKILFQKLQQLQQSPSSISTPIINTAHGMDSNSSNEYSVTQWVQQCLHPLKYEK